MVSQQKCSRISSRYQPFLATLWLVSALPASSYRVCSLGMTSFIQFHTVIEILESVYKNHPETPDMRNHFQVQKLLNFLCANELLNCLFG